MVKIISDSTCDLSRELLDKYDIDIIPLYIRLGDKEYLDGQEISPEELYKWSDANKLTPQTAACSIEQAMLAFQNQLEKDNDIICFSISESMSTTGNAMRLAAAELDAEERIHIVDSANLSTGVGLQVIEAAILAKEGKSAEEILEHIKEIRPLVRASFVVDTLTYLHRGGRCSGVAALAGGALKLHPKIVVENGKMIPTKKYRGKMNKVLFSYVTDMEEELKNAKPNRVFITHSGCAQEDIDAIKAYLIGLRRFDEILVTRAGGVISSHCGPGTLGVIFIACK